MDISHNIQCNYKPLTPEEGKSLSLSPVYFQHENPDDENSDYIIKDNFDTYMGVDPLNEFQLNQGWPNVRNKFVLYAPMVGSGMKYEKIMVGPEIHWYSSVVSRVDS